MKPYEPVKPRILRMFPPNIGRITKVLPHARKHGTIFTYGNTIYNPAGGKLPLELLAHELIHVEQQEGVNPEVWWAMYLSDPAFRLGVEIPAHKIEMDSLRARGLPYKHVPARLLSRLYGGVLPPEITLSDVEGLLDNYSYGKMGLAGVVGEDVADLSGGDKEHQAATGNPPNGHTIDSARIGVIKPAATRPGSPGNDDHV